MFTGDGGGSVGCVLKNWSNLTGKTIQFSKNVDLQFSSKILLSICSFPKKVHDSRIAKPYFAPVLVYKKIYLENHSQSLQCYLWLS